MTSNSTPDLSNDTTISSATDSIWPGPSGALLTPFEWYMVEDDSKQYPMTFTFVWKMKGNVDLLRWQNALNRVIQLHPLLTCGVSPISSPDRYRWVKRTDRVIIEEFSSTTDNEYSMPTNWQNIDIRTQHGLKAAVVRRTSDWLLILTVHHATADGIGSLEFSSDLFDQYRAGDRPNQTEQSSKRNRTRSISISLLDQRAALDRSIPHPVTRWTVIKSMAAEAYRFFFHPAARIGNKVPIDRSKSIGDLGKKVQSIVGLDNRFAEPFRLHAIALEESQTKLFRQSATNNGCSVHELLLAICMKVFAEYRVGVERKSKGWISAVVPLNMRLQQVDRAPCHNGIGYANIKRSITDCLSLWSNTQTLITDFKAIQQWHLGGMFLDALSILRRFPPWLSRLIIRTSHPGTFVLSFLGDPVRRFPSRFRETGDGLELDDCTVVNMAAAPPTRAGTEVALLASFFRNQLTLWLRTDGTRVNPQTIEDLQNRLRIEIEANLGSNPKQ